MLGVYYSPLRHNYGGISVVNGILYFTLGAYATTPHTKARFLPSTSPPARWSISSLPSLRTSSSSGGGIWGNGGVVYQLNGHLINNNPSYSIYTAAGNTINSGHEWDYYGEHVIQLNPSNLAVISSYSPNGLVDGSQTETSAPLRPCSCLPHRADAPCPWWLHNTRRGFSSCCSPATWAW